MGEIADSIINGEFDYRTGEYIGRPCGYPRRARRPRFHKDTPKEAEIRAIRKELAILIKSKQETCTTEQQKNAAVDQARHEINLKYGSGWRHDGLINNQ